MAAPRKPRTTDTSEPQSPQPRTQPFLDTQIHDPVTALQVADALIRDALDPDIKTSLEQAYRGSLALLNLAKIANEGREGGWLRQRTPPAIKPPQVTIITNVPETMTPDEWSQQIAHENQPDTGMDSGENGHFENSKFFGNAPEKEEELSKYQNVTRHRTK